MVVVGFGGVSADDNIHTEVLKFEGFSSIGKNSRFGPQSAGLPVNVKPIKTKAKWKMARFYPLG